MSSNNTNSGKSNEKVTSGRFQEARPSDTGEEWKRVEAFGRGASESAATRGHRHNRRTVRSLMGELLCDIYGTSEANKQTSASDHDQEVHAIMQLMSKDIISLKLEKKKLEKRINDKGNELIQQLQKKNFLLMKREAHCDLITAYIQAVSSKTREDTKMKFSLSPTAETGFSQWLDAMKMVAQLPEGMPSEFRTKLWLQLSEKHLSDQKIEWEKVEPTIFNEWTNPDDEELGVQIVKDLHRTGCSLFCGEQEHNQALLKRVLLAYARWNKNVGYCQGFNMLAALILQVMDKNEKNAIKVMIYLIEGVLPESYFANNLRGLSVDMAVFRDLLRLRLPKLSKHLETLQNDTISGTNYEPPLTNVFTMQWFLTLFSNCLPHQTVLRVWDLVFLYGNEVLLRTALAIWAILQDRVISVESADEFYSIMGVVSREMLEFGLMDANTLVKNIVMVDPFPNELQELREKYLYNISPWNQSMQCAARKGIKLLYHDADDQDDTEDEDKIALTTAYGVFRRKESSKGELQISIPTLDIGVLKQQYTKLRQRQRQAHVIITAAYSSNIPNNIASGPGVSVNHLLMGKSALINKEKRIGPPEGSIPLNSERKVNAESMQNKIRGKSLQCESVKASVKNEKIKDKQIETKEREKNEIINGMQNSTKNVLEVSEEEKSESSTSTELCDEVSDEEDALEWDLTLQDCKDGSVASNDMVFEELLDERQCYKICKESKKNEKLNCDNSNDSSNFEINKLAKRNLGGVETSDENFVQKLKDEGFKKKNENGSKNDEKHLNFDQLNNGQNIKVDNVINEISPLEFANLISFDNTNFLDYKPEVPMNQMIVKRNLSNKIVDTETKNVKELTKKDDFICCKSEIGLSVIEENLQMLNKFQALRIPEKKLFSSDDAEEEFKNGKEQKKEEKGEMQPNIKCKYSTLEENKMEKAKIDSNNYEMTKVQNVFPFLLPKSTAEVSKSSAINGSTLKIEKLNKEVNTEITFGVEEFRIPNEVIRLKGNAFLPDDKFSSSHQDFSNDEDADEVKTKIQVSKNDWELKMKKIAELETNTRKTLDEMKEKSVNCDRFRKQTTTEDSEKFEKKHLQKKTSGSSVTNLRNGKSLTFLQENDDKILSENLNRSLTSFDAITSRTEKLLKNVELERSTDDYLPFPMRDSGHTESIRRTPSNSSNSSKTTEEDFPKASTKLRPSFLQRQSLMKSSKEPHSSKNLSTSFTGATLRAGFPEVEKKRFEKDLEENGERALSFNPFPTRSISRTKELGLKFGLYQTYLHDNSKKS